MSDRHSPRMRATRSLLVAILLLAAPAAAAAGGPRYSGTIAVIDPDRGVMVIEEMGAGSGGNVSVTRRTITLTARTKFNRFIRVNAPGAFAGDFIEVVLDADDVSAGEFATAECRLERGRLVAMTVTLAELAEARTSPGGDQP